MAVIRISDTETGTVYYVELYLRKRIVLTTWRERAQDYARYRAQQQAEQLQARMGPRFEISVAENY